MMISRKLRCLVWVMVLAGLAASLNGMTGDAVKKKRMGGLLQILPRETLFCVKIKNLQQTGEAIEAFLEGITPEDEDISEDLLSSLNRMLGGEEPRAVRMKGTFGLFGVILPGEGAMGNPFANLFVGALVPVGNYENFVARNPNVGEPDEDGIATLRSGERTRGLALRKNQYAVLCEGHNREKLLRFKQMIDRKGRRLGGALDAEEKTLARTSPIWAYANIQQVGRTFGPMVYGQLENMKAMLKQAQERPEGPKFDPEAVVGFYREFFKVILEGTEHVAVGIAPSAEACRFTMQSKAVEGTLLAQMFSAPTGYAGNELLEDLLGYLDNGAFLNIAGKIDHESLKLFYDKMIDLMGRMAPTTVDEAEIGRFKTLTNNMIDAIGEGVAASLKAGKGEGGPFSFKYVIKVKGKKAFENVIEEQLKMIKEGAFNKLYKGFGMTMDIQADPAAAEHQGVKIGKARIAFQMGQADSQEDKMIKAIWGEGMTYTWAVLDGYALYAMGGDCDRTIRTLIDQVKWGGAAEPVSEIMTAVDVFKPDETRSYDFGGTFNIVRMMDLMSVFMKAAGGPQIEPLDMPTATNVVFGGWSADNKLTVETVLPKRHVLEIKAAGEEFDRRMRSAREK